MSELDIRFLVSEHTSLAIMCTQIWLAITSAFILDAVGLVLYSRSTWGHCKEAADGD